MLSRVVDDALTGFVIEDGTAVERGRDCVFMGNDSVEIGFGLSPGFNRTREAFQAAEAVKLLLVADSCCIE